MSITCDRTSSAWLVLLLTETRLGTAADACEGPRDHVVRLTVQGEAPRDDVMRLTAQGEAPRDHVVRLTAQGRSSRLSEPTIGRCYVHIVHLAIHNSVESRRRVRKPSSRQGTLTCRTCTEGCSFVT